ncbi:hypothetical protein QJQ45_007556 [Haematococcus lacustris]|nr:hypothetical protein QJQ45_007556 [Haematococcus lacustris]
MHACELCPRRHEHKALLHSLLPKAAIAKMQADCQWAAADSYQSQLCMVGSGTPAEMILGILEDILQGRPPALHRVMAVRHALQQSLDVYKPLQADLSQRMAHTPNMDVSGKGHKGRRASPPLPLYVYSGEVKDALMLQLVGRTAAAETVEGDGEEVKEGSMGVLSTKRPDPAVSSVLLHIMAQQQAERPPPCSGAALLAGPAGAVAGPELLVLPQPHPAWRPVRPATRQDAIPRTIMTDDDNATTSRCRALASHPLPVNAGAGQGLVALNPLLQVEPCLSSANSWSFDAFELNSATAGRPLSVLAFWLLHQSGLTAWASMDTTKLARWLCRIEDGYCANPYHNRSHAADVVQTMHMLLTKGGLMPGYADHLTQLAAYLAAVCHDYQHIGRTNDWLVETQDELALRYNDRSPMENHHLAGAFSLLKHPDLNFLQAMPKASYDRLRKLMIELVLGTDSLNGSKKGEGVPPACNNNNNSPSLEPCLQPVSDQDKLVSMQAALKCSDLGHLAAPLPVHLAWVSRLEAEFFAQGDAERAQGLPISPLCDRTKQGITKSQVGFFEFVALPLFNNFTARFTAAKPLLQGVMANYHYWQAQAAAMAAEGSAATTVGSDGQRTCGSRQQS